MASLYLAEPGAFDGVAVGARAAIEGEEARHAASVARVRVGESLAFADGAGVLVRGAVVAASPERVEIEVDEIAREPVPRPELRLAQALAKGDRDELAIQAATELGVDGVIPWAAERSVVRWQGAKVDRGVERWRAIVREASKQSIRARVPAVAPPASTAELARGVRPDHALLVLEPTAERPLATLALPEVAAITLVVGPEGGIAPREREVLAAAGAVEVRLGPGVLRTSTAGPAALAALAVRLGRWA
ncbi:MAG: 16S rRNA (uracil(1498)-N(3))-methyltransferase [Actinomycetales bacterium]|nr:16S rRNA (uracil(1498)-N(3))-methyltransferase [Actinomycetales bacterium]